MGHLVVIAPPEVADGFALGGADILLVETRNAPALWATAEVMEVALAGGAAVVAVHHTLWGAVPTPVRERWEQRIDRLIVALPADDGASTFDRAAALHELLARAVGYEISFSPNGDPE